MHKDADKFVPGAVWNDSFGDLTVHEKLPSGGYSLKLMDGTITTLEGEGWKEPHHHWHLVKPAPDKAMPLGSEQDWKTFFKPLLTI